MTLGWVMIFQIQDQKLKQQNQTGLHQNYKLSCFSQNYKNVEKPSTERKEILENCTSDKGLNACIQNIFRTPTTQ